ncbi:bombesin-like protein [Gemelliphila asaccharolytica]|uniref:Bombesin-like protein n=1 Tax=Gemelliphila asaccharolytica TaxID=502393 RepID=A0ABR5TPC0_9BACL|nr:bombesin-like protein [Gemella asaccharolytica]
MSTPVMCRPQKVRSKSNDWKVGIFMAKHSFEFKKKVALEYSDDKGGTKYFSESRAFYLLFFNIFMKNL